MAVMVQKYGGTSVADPGRIEAVADRVAATRSKGFELVVVVSAMGQTTNQLVEMARQISPMPPPRELDMLLTAGERITMALLAMALHERGIPAVSYTGSQAGILTDSSHGQARITRITGERVRDSVAEGKVVIVAGFQGVDPDRREVTTLGRGGSDTTAVALASTLGAVACEILTDVAGVFSADPRLVEDAVKLDEIGYESMIALARAGAGVLMPDSVEMARDRGVLVEVRSSFTEDPGTRIHADVKEQGLIGIAHTLESATVAVVGREAAGLVERINSVLDEASIQHQSPVSGDGHVSVRVSREQIEDAVRCLHRDVIHLENAR